MVDAASLDGGMSTALTVLTTASGRRAVLRQYPSPQWETKRAGRAATGEALALAALANGSVPAPSLLAVAADHEDVGPAVLMSLCHGGRYQGDGVGIAHELGRILAGIHAIPPVARLADATLIVVQNLRAGRPHRRGSASALLELVVQSIPDEIDTRQRVLVHNDFSVSNVLVEGDTVSAIVDWTEASQGDPGSDLAFAYVSTALSFGTSAADQLLQGYQSRAAWPVHDLAWWQLLAASRLEPDIDTWTRSANFLGPADLTTAEVRRRFDVLIDTIARNLGETAR